MDVGALGGWADVATDGAALYLVGEMTGKNCDSMAYGGWIVAKVSSDGETRWTKELKRPWEYGEPSHAALAPDGVYVLGRLALCRAGHSGQRLEKRALDDGEVLWERDFETEGKASYRDLAADDSGVYLVGTESVEIEGYEYGAGPGWYVEKRRPSDGEVVWSVPPDAERPGNVSAVALDGTGLYVLGTHGVPWEQWPVWAVEKRSREDGALVWRVETTRPVDAHVAVRGGEIWAAGRGIVEQRAADTGALRSVLMMNLWGQHLAGAPWALALGEAGAAFVGGQYVQEPGREGWEAQVTCLHR